VVRFLGDGVHLLLRQLGRVDRIGQREHAARGHEFDDVGAVLDLVAHRGAALVGAVADAVDRPALRHAARGRDRVAVAVSAGGADGVDGGEDARPRRQPGVDGVAQADVDVVLGADVPHRGEAGLEGLLRVRAGVEGLLRRLAHHALEEVEVEVVARLAGEMHVRVDESR